MHAVRRLRPCPLLSPGKESKSVGVLKKLEKLRLCIFSHKTPNVRKSEKTSKRGKARPDKFKGVEPRTGSPNHTMRKLLVVAVLALLAPLSLVHAQGTMAKKPMMSGKMMGGKKMMGKKKHKKMTGKGMMGKKSMMKKTSMPMRDSKGRFMKKGAMSSSSMMKKQ